MKILMVNKFYYVKGGSETYYFALKKMLEEQGHTVVDFSMKDEKNFASPYSDYFVENVDYSNSNGIVSQLKMAGNIIYSTEAKKKFEALVIKEKPDLIHLHVFQHQLSPSILDIVKKYGIPTVYTAHDLKMICLNYKMMHHGTICEECKAGKYYYCAKNRCVKDSLVKSCVNVVEGYLHKWRGSYDVIDTVITPSAFYKAKFEEFGLAPDRVCHIPNFLDRAEPKVNIRPDRKQYYLYFGRLSEEKGVMTLIKSAKATGILLYIVGTGPLRKQLEEYINNHNLMNIIMLGFKQGQELIDLVGNSKAVVLPSEWYENGPYSAIEALQVSRPIIGARIGGIPELIHKNGFLFESGDIGDLTNIITTLEEMEYGKYQELELDSFELFKKEYSWEGHYRKLSDIYQKAVKKQKGKAV